jgi:biotin carboxylase
VVVCTLMTRPVVCVVDGYSSGSLYAAELEARGIDCVHVQADPQISPYDLHSFELKRYLGNIIFDGDFEKLQNDVANHRVIAVFPGAETGVLVADRLSEALGVFTNGTARSLARRDKYAMQRQIASAGLRAIESTASHRWDEIAAWLDDRKSFPVVIKPVASAGSDHVFICDTREQVRAAFELIIGSINSIGLQNERAIAQPYVVGEEYAVDTVSCGGNHQVTSIWHQHKVHGERPLYDYSELIDPRGATAASLIGYVYPVLDALGIRFGPAHTEVLVDQVGPVLVECGVRNAGGQVQIACKHAFGFSQITLSLDAYLAPQRFFERMSQPYQLPPHVRRVWLSSPKSGTLVALPRLDQARSLPSAFWVKTSVAIGDALARTIDLETLPGWIDLVHANPGVVDADYRQIRQWEADDFYQVRS